MFENRRELTRILMFLSGERERLGAGLVARKAELRARFGPEAVLDMGRRRLDDPFSAIGMDRKIEPADALLQVSYPANWAFADIETRLAGLAEFFEDIADISKSTVSVGKALVLVEEHAAVFCAFIGRRRPDLTAAQMSAYWTDTHAPLAVKLTGQLAPHGYDQLHIDRELSARAAAAAGFAHVPYDMADSLNIPDLALFLKVLTQPEIMQALYEDEKEFLDHSSWRGVFTERV